MIASLHFLPRLAEARASGQRRKSVCVGALAERPPAACRHPFRSPGPDRSREENPRTRRPALYGGQNPQPVVVPAGFPDGTPRQRPVTATAGAGSPASGRYRYRARPRRGEARISLRRRLQAGISARDMRGGAGKRRWPPHGGGPWRTWCPAADAGGRHRGTRCAPLIDQSGNAL